MLKKDKRLTIFDIVVSLEHLRNPLMKNNKKLLINAFLSLTGILAFTMAIISRHDSVSFGVGGDSTPYSIVLETNKNKIGEGAFSPTATHSGNGFATTELGNQISFEYNQLYNPTNYWQTIKAGGYITNTQPIMGMSSISLTKSGTTGNFGVYWSNTKTFTSERYALFDTSSPLNVTTDFAGYMPNYIKIVAIANTSIVSGAIEFSCADNYNLSYNVIVTSENLEMGTVSGSGQYDYDESVTITATPNNGYEFIGWYQDSTLVSSLAAYTFTMPSNSLNYVAKFNPLSYDLELISEDSNKGTVSGSGTYPYTQSRSITATPQSGYSFVGWFEGETLVSSDNPYTFTMPYNNLSYVAKFSTNLYILTLASNDINKGTVAGEGTFAYQSEVTVTATAIEGNEFIGWYQGATLMSSNPSYTFTMPYNELSLIAKFVTQYTVAISSFDETLGTVSGGGAHGHATSVTITATPTAGNGFVAWYDDSFNVVSKDPTYTFQMPEHDVVFYAEFKQKLNVYIESRNELLGTVSGGGDFIPGDNVTITATPTIGNWFVAWYDDNMNNVSTKASYTFTMPDYAVNYYAEFSPVEKGYTVQFGIYPQTKVTDDTLLSSLNSASGTLPTSANSQAWTSYGYYKSGAVSSYMWYIDITNETDEYRGVYFTSYRPYYIDSPSNSYQDDNGYTTSSVYWFKYEPITWRVLDVQAEKAFLMANLVLDSQDYHYSTSNRTIGVSTVYANNYEHSHIRSWLNDTFYNTAFNAAEKAKILTTTVDNSVASTGYSTNQYACANTSDKVFLLSYAEATSATYGLNTDASRQLQPSAYAQSQGVCTYTSNGNSYWWLRSPGNYVAYNVSLVSNDGRVRYLINVYDTSRGVVPALWISL